MKKRVREKSRECHNHKPQPFPDPKRKRKPNQVSSTVTRRKRKSSFDLKRFNKVLHTDALVAICSSLRDLGTQQAVSLRIPKRSCKIVEMLPCEMPNTCAISSTWIWPASVAQLNAPSNWRPGGREFNPRRGRQHSFVEIDHEIFSTVILSLPLIQEGQLSVSGERMCTILVNRLED